MVLNRVPPRWDIAPLPEGLRITIPIRVGHAWLVMLIVFMAVWACGSLGIALVMIAQGLQGRGDELALALFPMLTGPVVGGLLFRWYKWYREGKEIITVVPARLILRYDLNGHGEFQRFKLSAIRDLRASPETHNPRSFWQGFACGDITFNYADLNYRFGIGLGREEAGALVALLQEYLPGNPDLPQQESERLRGRS
jgi:hypothetical protein